MPCATIHMSLADRVLRRWDAHPGDAPIPIREPRIRDAFLHGAMGPDMGFVPGTDRLVSELAHYHLTGDLSRALLRAAESPEAEAFAWGWATHVLGDAELHPVVGRAVGEFLYGDRERRVDALEDVETHVSLEVGLDLVIYHRDRHLPRPPSVPWLRGDRVRLLQTALTDTYSVGWDRETLLYSHRRAVELTAWWPRALEALALRSGRRPGESGLLSARLTLGSLQRLLPSGSAARGFLGVRVPPGWVVAELDRRMEGFENRFQGLVESKLEALENWNMETGGPAGPGYGHPASDQVVKKLERLLTAPAPRSSPSPRR